MAAFDTFGVMVVGNGFGSAPSSMLDAMLGGAGVFGPFSETGLS